VQLVVFGKANHVGEVEVEVRPVNGGINLGVWNSPFVRWRLGRREGRGKGNEGVRPNITKT
jgi:hypothetical protein